MKSRIVPVAVQAFDIMPHLPLARAMAASWGEPVAIFRYNDGYPDDVFIRPLFDLDHYRQADTARAIMLELVVNPPKEA